MAWMATRFAVLEEADKEVLTYLKDHGETPRIRQRAHAVLLSAQKRPIKEIAEIFQVHRDTVARWIKHWESSGVQGLADDPRPGAPPQLDAEEKEFLLELIKKHPHSPKTVLHELKEQTNKTISERTLRRIDWWMNLNGDAKLATHLVKLSVSTDAVAVMDASDSIE